MKLFIKKICELINVKSIVTIMLTTVFCYLSATANVTSEQFQTVFTVIIAFYFGTQHQKNADKNNENNMNDKGGNHYE